MATPVKMWSGSLFKILSKVVERAMHVLGRPFPFRDGEQFNPGSIGQGVAV